MNYSCTQDAAACTGIHPLNTSSAKGYCQAWEAWAHAFQQRQISQCHHSKQNSTKQYNTSDVHDEMGHSWSNVLRRRMSAQKHQVLSLSQLLLLHPLSESLNLSARFGGTRWRGCPFSHSVQLTCGLIVDQSTRGDPHASCIEKKRRWFATHVYVSSENRWVVSKNLPKTPKNSGRFPDFQGAWFRKLWKWRCGYVWQLHIFSGEIQPPELNLGSKSDGNAMPSFEPLQRHFSTPKIRITETTKAVYLQAVFRKCIRKKTQAPSWSAPCIWSIWASTKTLQGQLPATGWTSLDLWKLQTTHELIRTRSIIASVSISLQIFA